MKIFDNLHGYIWHSTTVNNSNSYLIDGPTRILIDPGHAELFSHVEKGLEKSGMGIDDIGLIVCTHAHPDHIEAAGLFDKTSALITIHQSDFQFLKDMAGRHANEAYKKMIDSFKSNFFLKQGNMKVNGIDFIVLHTPGHSPGSICLYWPEKKTLFTGDLIFQEGIGRTDLPGGNADTIKESIKGIMGLDLEYLLPGHGEIIIGAEAIRKNFELIGHYYFR